MKIFLLLLCLSSSSTYSMIVSTHDKFLEKMLTQNLDDLSASFKSMTPDNREKALQASGDAQPYILMSMLPKGIQTKIFSYITPVNSFALSLTRMPIDEGLDCLPLANKYHLESPRTGIILKLEKYAKLTEGKCFLLKTVTEEIKKDLNNNHIMLLTEEAFEKLHNIDREVNATLLNGVSFKREHSKQYLLGKAYCSIIMNPSYAIGVGLLPEATSLLSSLLPESLAGTIFLFLAANTTLFIYHKTIRDFCIQLEARAIQEQPVYFFD